ncbi:hypothetical protein CMI37_26450 [Candidatus Pacearchaeota archaeon]|nr:hypothetical protein [Candidatus Pacearchaeota archaeon]
MNTNQLLKAMGWGCDVSLSDLDSDSASSRIVTDEAIEAISGRMCFHPDEADEEIALADPGVISGRLDLDEESAVGLKQLHERMLAAKSGSGSFPIGCYPSFPERHAVKFFIDKDTFPEHYLRPVTAAELEQIVEAGVWRWSRQEIFDINSGRPMIDVAMWLSVEAYRLLGVQHIEVFDGPNGSEHNIHIKATNQPGSQIGVAWFNNGTCGDHVNNHLDSSYRPGLMACAKLLCHELGHNHNAQHQFRGQSSHHGVMSYDPPRLFYGYSTGQAPHVLPRDPSLVHFEEVYGLEPIPLTPGSTGDVPAPVDPPASDVVVTRFEDNGQEYVITRKGSPPSDTGGVWR